MFIIDDILAANAAGKLLPVLIGAGAAVAVGFASAEVYEHKAPWGLAHKRDTAIAERDKARGEAKDWARAYGSEKQAFTDAEGLRRQEGSTARAAAQADAAQCSSRVAEARRSALAIHDIVSTEVPHDPQGCPVRVLVDPGRLRDALQRRPGAQR